MIKHLIRVALALWPIGPNFWSVRIFTIETNGVYHYLNGPCWSGGPPKSPETPWWSGKTYGRPTVWSDPVDVGISRPMKLKAVVYIIILKKDKLQSSVLLTLVASPFYLTRVHQWSTCLIKGLISNNTTPHHLS